MIHWSPRRTRPATAPEVFRAGAGEEFEVGVAFRPVSSVFEVGLPVRPVPPVFEVGLPVRPVSSVIETGVGGRG